MVSAPIVLAYHPADEAWKHRVVDRLRFAQVEPLTLDGRPRSPEAALGSRPSLRLVVLLISKSLLESEGQLRLRAAFANMHGSGHEIGVLGLEVEDCTAWAPFSLNGFAVHRLPIFGRAKNADRPEALFEAVEAHVRAALQSSQAEASPKPTESDLDELFHQIYTQHYPRLVVFFGRRGLDPETSRDLAQKSMLRAYQGIDGLRAHVTAQSWVLRIATNIWCNWVRDNRFTSKRAVKESSLESAREVGLEVAESGGLWSIREQNPERLAAEKEVKERIRERIASLSARQQDCLIRWLDGSSYQEVASELGISLQTVRGSLHKAKQRLIEELRPSFTISDTSNTGSGGSKP